MAIECKKAKFATEKDADFFIQKLKATSKRAKIPTSSYFCQRCTSWHLTSLKQNEWKEAVSLKKQLESLKLAHKEEVKVLKEQISLLKQENTKEVNVDSRIKKMNNTLLEKLKTINRLRQDNKDLISKNIQLEKRLKP